ncbi:MAG: hypothetical protein HQK96_03900 [Nitrospirae bacterium]|nr:hypothetical protein [Nitrospirota bacterium]
MESQLLGALSRAIIAVAVKIKAIYDKRATSKRLSFTTVLIAIGSDLSMSKETYMRHAPAAAITQNVMSGPKDNALKRLSTSVDMIKRNPHTTEAAIKELRAQR